MVPECAEANGNQRFEWEGDYDTCQRCGSSGYPAVILLALLHFLIPDQAGQIRGKYGRRFRMACHKSREYLATMTNQEGATNDLKAVSCPECIREAGRLGIEGVSPGGILLTEEQVA